MGIAFKKEVYKLLELINMVGKVAGYKNHLYFYTLTRSNLKMKFIKLSFTVASKRIKFLGISLTKEV